MAHHRNLAYHPTNRSYPSGDDRDFSPPDEDSRSGRGDKTARKRNSVAVRTLWLYGRLLLSRAKTYLRDLVCSMSQKENQVYW